MNSIVLDLEWNQAQTRDREAPGLTFEVIEIGAVRLDEHGNQTDSFSCLIRPCVYTELFYRVREVVGISMKQLEAEGIPFLDAMERFWKWCGKDPVFFTWGDMDLMELQRNIAYFGMENPFAFPLFYYDVQKLYSLYCLDGHARASLESVIDALALPKKWPFHRAVYDAAYTGCVLSQLEKQSWQSMVSVDYYRPPKNAQEEIYLVFERYSKFVSQLYPSREEAMEARNVSSMVCYKCGRNVTRRMNWFSDNNRKYFGLAYCPRHGWLKGKIRVKHCDGQVFMIKTMKLTDAEGARKIKAKSELMKKRRMDKAAEKGLRTS